MDSTYGKFDAASGEIQEAASQVGTVMDKWMLPGFEAKYYFETGYSQKKERWTSRTYNLWIDSNPLEKQFGRLAGSITQTLKERVLALLDAMGVITGSGNECSGRLTFKRSKESLRVTWKGQETRLFSAPATDSELPWRQATRLREAMQLIGATQAIVTYGTEDSLNPPSFSFEGPDSRVIAPNLGIPGVLPFQQAFEELLKDTDLESSRGEFGGHGELYLDRLITARSYWRNWDYAKAEVAGSRTFKAKVMASATSGGKSLIQPLNSTAIWL